jgi:TonB family protein
MRILSALVVALLGIATAQAECTRPRPDFEIPQGATAAEKDLVAAQQKLVQFDGVVGEYLRCLRGEASQQSVGKDEATKKKIADAYVAAHDAAALELSGLADCFNAQLADFRSSGGGTEPKPADCSTHIANAGSREPSAAPPVPEGLVKEADGHTFELASGVWSYTLIRDDRPRLCGEKREQICLIRTVYVSNGSDEVLECAGTLAYEGADIDGRAEVQSKAVVSAKQTRAVVTSAAPREVAAKTFDAQCTARAPLPALDTDASCRYEVVQPVSISDYYPDDARKAGQEGPVVVEFSVGNKPGNPKDVKAVASSLFPALDEAAVKAVSDMVMKSNCRKGRYRLKMSFQLEG